MVSPFSVTPIANIGRGDLGRGIFDKGRKSKMKNAGIAITANNANIRYFGFMFFALSNSLKRGKCNTPIF